MGLIDAAVRKSLQGQALAALERYGWPVRELPNGQRIETEAQWRAWVEGAAQHRLTACLSALDFMRAGMRRERVGSANLAEPRCGKVFRT
jgi:hypothetical protein